MSASELDAALGAIRSKTWLDGLPQVPCHHCGGGGTTLDDAAVGRELRSQRTAAKIALTKVAREMGYGLPYVHDLEHGRRSWNAEKINAYLKALGPSNAAR